MNEKRFIYGETDLFEWVEDNGKIISTKECVNKLNEQQDTIVTLRRRLEKINGGYGHLTHRNGLTANEWVIESQEKALKKKNGQISDWIERHSKDIVKIGEQKATISQLEEEKEYWKGKAMTLLMQVRRLTPRMTDKEVIEFSKELDDE